MRYASLTAPYAIFLYCGVRGYAVSEQNVWVHNKCPELPDSWVAKSIKDTKNWNGCEQCAKEIQEMIGGEIKRITPNEGRYLGKYRGANPNWYHHEVVVKNGKVFDAFGPKEGVSINEYKSLFEYSDAINFGF